MSQRERQDLGEWNGESYEAICKRKNSRIAQLERTNAALLGALKRIVSDFETDFVLDGKVVDEPYRIHQMAWEIARAAIAEAESLEQQKERKYEPIRMQHSRIFHSRG